MENSYPEPWHRQTPKGFDPFVVVKEKCCECSCNTEETAE